MSKTSLEILEDLEKMKDEKTSEEEIWGDEDDWNDDEEYNYNKVNTEYDTELYNDEELYYNRNSVPDDFDEFKKDDEDSEEPTITDIMLDDIQAENEKEKEYDYIDPPKGEYNGCFFKIPLSLLRADITEKRIDALIQLQLHTNPKTKTTMFCLNNLIKNSGYKVLKNRSVADPKYVGAKIRTGVEWLYKNNFILDYDKKSLTGTTFNESRVNYEVMFPKSKYGKIYDFEVNYIIDKLKDSKKMTSSHVLIVLAYIRAVMTHTRADKDISFIPRQEEQKYRNPEFFYTYINRFSDEVHLSRRIVSSAIIFLIHSGIILCRKPKKNNENYKRGFTVIVNRYRYVFNNLNKTNFYDNTYDAKMELHYGFHLLNNNDE